MLVSKLPPHFSVLLYAATEQPETGECELCRSVPPTGNTLLRPSPSLPSAKHFRMQRPDPPSEVLPAVDHLVV